MKSVLNCTYRIWGCGSLPVSPIKLGQNGGEVTTMLNGIWWVFCFGSSQPIVRFNLTPTYLHHTSQCHVCLYEVGGVSQYCVMSDYSSIQYPGVSSPDLNIQLGEDMGLGSVFVDSSEDKYHPKTHIPY
jgi:hypothetical protein